MVSIQFGIEGPVQTLSAFSHTVSGVLEMARSWLEDGTAEIVLAGAGDEYCPARGYATARMSDGVVPSEIQPLVFDKCSYLPGEGFTVFILADEKKHPAKHGVLEEIFGRIDINETGRVLNGGIEALFLSANGNRAEGKTYAKINAGNIPVHTYSQLYGGFPCGTALNIAAALSSGKNSVLCAEYSEDDELNLYKLRHI